MLKEAIAEVLGNMAARREEPHIIGHLREMGDDASRVAVKAWRSQHGDPCVLLVSEIARVEYLGGNNLVAIYLANLQATAERLRGAAEPGEGVSDKVKEGRGPAERPPGDPDGYYCSRHTYYAVWHYSASENYVEAVGCC